MSRLATLACAVCLSISGSVRFCVAGTLSTPPNGEVSAFNGVFSTSNQSVWGPGSVSHYDHFFGLEWGPSFDTIGGIWCDPVLGDCYGAMIFGSTFGRVGLEFGLDVTSGSVSVSMPFSGALYYNDIVSGPSFTVTSDFGFDNGGSLETTGPTVTGSADLDFRLYAYIGATGCFIGCGTVGGELVNFDTRLHLWGDHAQGPDTSGEGSTQITSSGSATLFSPSWDAAEFASSALGFPLSASLSFDDLFSLDYSLLKATLGLDLILTQDFTFVPSLGINLHVQETGQDIPLPPRGASSPITFPPGVTLLHLIPTYTLGGAFFTNDTDGCIKASGQISVLSAGLGLAGDHWDFGPMYTSPEFITGCIVDLDLYTKTFPLGGFNSFTGPTLSVYEGPEPSAVLVLGSGLLALGLLRLGAPRIK